MCNCNNNNSLCSRCSKGLMCACPPDYSVTPLTVDCGCCPPGYTWTGATANWPNGVCTGQGGRQVSPIPCTTCVDSVPGDCVFLPAIPCFGVIAGTTLTSFINYLCSDAFTMKILSNIGLSTTLKTALCQLTTTCPPASSSTPIIVSIVTTAP
jgi:hypothetical protein